MRRFCLFLVVATLAVTTMLSLAGPAEAQTPPASASLTDGCAVASSVLAQLPPAPTTSASAAAPPSAAQPSATLTSYSDTVLPGRGIEISAGTIVDDTRFGATFVGEVVGDLPGNLIASVNYVPPAPGPSVTNEVVGGEWALCGPQGTVFGSFTSGTVQWNADETLADITANMNVVAGSVNGVSVSGGAGTFRGVLDHRPLVQGLPPTVSGALQLQSSGAPTTTSSSGVLPSTGGPSLMVGVSAALLLISGLLGLGILRRF
jgi:hypothetical protein